MKKGFTLIELLAVIVILAIIATIATIVVFKIIEDSKIAKYKVEETSLKKAAELYFVTNDIIPYPDEISLSALIENGYMKPIIDNGNNGYCEGKVILDEKDNLKGCLKCSNYQTEGCGYVKEETEVPEEPDDIVNYDKVIDSDPGIICGTNNQDTECHIKSIEDLVAFSQLVNEGNTFSGKTVYLDTNLDIQNDNSYVNASNNAPYDINGDTEITSLKDELTTDAGFMPIGGTSKYFRGKFIGNAYTINNLMINRPSTDCVGLFGYIYGMSSTQKAEVIGLNVENVNVKGNNNVGGLVGIVGSYSTISEVVVSGNVEGNDYIGGAIGRNSNGYIDGALVRNINVTGRNYVSGLSAYGTSEGVVESATIEGNNYVYGSYSSSVFVNDKDVIIRATAENATTSIGGIEYTSSEYGNLNLYDYYLDTWLAGDNNDNGHYFDYDSTGKVILTNKVIDTTFAKGAGTQDNPYEIYTASDMKKIAAIPKEVNYYKLMKNIDYSESGNYYYVIANGNANHFKGVFIGNAHTIKNVNILGYDYVGLFGYIYGTSSAQQAGIVGLNLENVNVNGNNNVGGLAGYLNSNSYINEIAINGEIEGNSYVGGVVGNKYSSASVKSVLATNINVKGNTNIYGLSNNSSVGVIESGTIKGNSTVYGMTYPYSLINKDVIVEGNSIVAKGGIEYTLSEHGNLNLYDQSLDTWLGGDDDNSGFYFDYDNTGKVVLRSVDEYPINTTFAEGDGTQDNPYLIRTVADMKKIAAIPKEVNYYKLMNDIDYGTSGSYYYMIGNSNKLYNGNYFKGVFIGNAHTIKNVNISGYEYVGLFGYVYGISNAQRAQIISLNVENINVSGTTWVGGLVGYTYNANISEIMLNGTIVGNSHVGGIIGNMSNNSLVNNSIVNATVTSGNTSLGGLTGYTYSSPAIGINEGNSKELNYGTKISDEYYNNLQYYSTLKNGNNPIIETPYSGDLDGSGFYFDYNAKGDDIVVVKAGNTTSTTQEISYTKTVDEGDDKTAPTCEIGRYSVVGNGFSASYSCTDNVQLKSKKHIYSASKITNFENLIEWGTTDTDGPVNSVWTVESASSQGISGPEKGVCYYFYFGGQDEAGNTVIYSTPTCLKY